MPTRSLRCHDRSRSSDDIPGRTAGAARQSRTELASTNTLTIAGIAAAGRWADAPSDGRPPGSAWNGRKRNGRSERRKSVRLGGLPTQRK